jgi:hypothetical protein
MLSPIAHLCFSRYLYMQTLNDVLKQAISLEVKAQLLYCTFIFLFIYLITCN